MSTLHSSAQGSVVYRPTLPLMNSERRLITQWPIMSDYFTAVHAHSSIEFRPCQTAIAMSSGVLAASSLALSAGTFVSSLSLRVSFRRSDIHYSNRFPHIDANISILGHSVQHKACNCFVALFTADASCKHPSFDRPTKAVSSCPV